ncbi:MAG: AAA family ATPase [Phaeodactylibacter sp.]|nr:AAA family ATPase [Phaeodactylibacter sp.]MCB9264530.1 AAA family ATPase [Lewinellaceae bacterium]
MKKIYVAATGQHVGKTTSTLGLVSNLQIRGFRTGYCKPVGQEYLTVDGKIADKDAVLFSQVVGFDIIPEIHSPVVLARGATKDYLDDPSKFNYPALLQEAASKLESVNDIMVYEGTGHPGVGSVVNLSNADVAELLGAGIIMVVEGGVGRTIDRLHMSTALFREKNLPILGVIVNKVIPEKREEIKHYLSLKLNQMKMPLLGVVPYDRSLSFPIMETINQAVNGKVITNEHRLSNRVEDIIAGSLVDIDEFNTFRNILLVVSYKRLVEAIDKIHAIAKVKKLARSPLSGVIVTGDGRHENWYKLEDIRHPYLLDNEIPILSTVLDTYGSVVKISRIEVKINTRTPWKVKKAISLIKEHVDFECLLERLDILERGGVLK